VFINKMIVFLCFLFVILIHRVYMVYGLGGLDTYSSLRVVIFLGDETIQKKPDVFVVVQFKGCSCCMEVRTAYGAWVITDDPPVAPRAQSISVD